MALSTIPFSGLGADASNQGVNFRNLIINGDMSIAQRGTSTSGLGFGNAGYYTCDRWRSQTDTGTWTISQSTDVPTGQGFTNSFKMDCTSAGTANSDEVGIRYIMEGQHAQHLAYGTSSAKSITISFWIKTNKTGTYTYSIRQNNSTENRLVGFNYTVDSADTWEKKTFTFAGDTDYSIDNTNEEEFTSYWWFSTASAFRTGTVSNTWQNYNTANHASSSLAGLGGSTDDYVNITGVQLEVGTSASDFEFLPYDVNLRRCQRYYQETQIGIYFDVVSGRNYGTNSNFHTQMRTTPSVISSTTIDNNNRFNSGAINGSPFLSTHGILAHKGAILTSDAGYYQTLVRVDAEL